MTKVIHKSENSWLNYLDELKDQTLQHEQLSITGFDSFINSNGLTQQFFRQSVPFVYLLDYRVGKYINMSENFAGYKAEAFLTGGISHTLDIYQPDHLRLFDKEIFPDRLQILKGIKPEEHKNYIFSYNGSVKNKNGKYEGFLQRSSFISDTAGNPLFSMGILINTSNFIDNGIIRQTVDKVDTEGIVSNELVCHKYYYLNEEDKLFTKREKDVLQWMAEGLSSKEIAKKLFVSEHTILTHRKNMQEKTNLPNAIALVSFAIKNRII
ncbi:regulatory protein, luxR family [Mucilaginibacter pineti]|uniref:Regulatory protein, luxR family n=1 Tax=Mucilaginibacter pineti TaxID=1391627 RepID=A0A1G6XED0_9SPHI|nr:helix-turn-helix transcriptional regulator [Mucilaginibacter pineti]SDD75596.1 regulatory protein, luxR family [Mucilaginibacter pineti]